MLSPGNNVNLVVGTPETGFVNGVNINQLANEAILNSGPQARDVNMHTMMYWQKRAIAMYALTHITMVTDYRRCIDCPVAEHWCVVPGRGWQRQSGDGPDCGDGLAAVAIVA